MEELEIKIMYHDNGVGEKLEKIEKISVGDWIDLRAAETVHLYPNTYKAIPLGVSMKLPEGYEAHIAPRSSTFNKWGIVQTNGVGIVDNSYSGDNDEWKMPVWSVGDVTVHKNDRICQFRIMKRMPPIKFTEVETLGSVDRGGFGSTGTN